MADDSDEYSDGEGAESGEYSDADHADDDDEYMFDASDVTYDDELEYDYESLSEWSDSLGARYPAVYHNASPG